VLPELTAEDLKDLGVGMIGHRRLLLNAIAALRAELAAVPDVSTSAAPAAGAAAERRQLTVMFCDLVGSTALSARLDPEELREVIGTYHRCVAEAVRRFDGFVAKYMGDGVLVYFGYPRAHEDDAERAVRAGLAVVEAVRGVAAADPLEVRIGIATGLVVVGDLIGEGAAQEQAVVGETPNLAARLQALAAPGSVVIAPATRRLLGNLFRLQALGRHEVKGLSEPVEAWAVEGVSASEGRFEAARSGRLTGFVGREYELGLLLERWRLAQDGEGQVVLLSGEPGIGKSRILSELRSRLEARHATSLRLHCSPYYVNSAFYPLIDNFERALRFARDDTAEQKLDKLEALVVSQYGRPREDVRFIAAMLSIPPDERSGAAAMTPQKFKDETLRALVDTTEAIARRQPTVMLFEDAHWADPTTLEVIDLLIHRVRDIPLLVVLTHRPEFSSRWSHHGHVAALTLTKLTRPQGSAMVSRLAGKTLPADLLDQVLDKTDGVPLFVEELTKSILESGNLRDAGDRWEYAGRAGTLAIPMTLRDSLMARLDRYAPVKEIAQTGAAIRREFSYELLAAVAPNARLELDQALTQLVESGLAFQRGTPPDAIYTFKHALVQDAAYDSLLRRRRQELHSKIANVIEDRLPNIEATEPELLARHYTEAKQHEKALPLWQKAGSLALGHMALAEAIAHLNKGLELVAALPASAERDGSELDLRTLLGTAWIALRGWGAQEVWDSLHPALGMANALRRSDALLPILWGLFVHVLVRGRVAESLRWVEHAMKGAETCGDPDLPILGHLAATTAYFWLGDPIKVREHADRVSALYSEERHVHLAGILNNDPKTMSLVFSAHSTWMLGYPQQALRIDNIAHEHARRRGHPFELSWALTHGARVLDYLGEPDEFLKRIEEGERVARENSLPFVTECLVPLNYGSASIRKGRIAEGTASLERGLAAWEGGGGRVSSPQAKSELAAGMAQLGDVAGALDLVDEAIAQIERPGWEERHYYAETLRIKGWLLSIKGDQGGAERAYIASLDWARTQQAKSWELRTATSYARLMRGQGRVREAHDLLAPVYAWFTEGFATKDLKDAKALLEELETSAARASAAHA
jgi:class 3 adenylate cyclase